MAASLLFKGCEDHSLLRSYNGGLWKTFTGLSPMPSVFLWDKAKQCRPRSDQNAESDQGLHCLLTECSIKVLIKNDKYHLTTLKTEINWSNLIQWEIPFGLNGLN